MTGFTDDFNAGTKGAFYTLMDDAVWIKQSGGSVPIKADFNNEPLKDELGNVINIDNPMAQCYGEDVTGILPNDSIAVQDAQYLITDVLDQGDGMVDLILRKM